MKKARALHLQGSSLQRSFQMRWNFRLAFWCSPATGGQTTPEKRIPVRGGGATFPSPFYQIAIADFDEKFPGLDRQILYNQKLPDRTQIPLGSEKGIELVRGKSLDFAGSDWPLSHEELARLNGIQVPTVLGAVAVVYNLPGLPRTFTSWNTLAAPRLNFSADVLARIFQGTITQWDDPYIERENPGINFPSAAIVPVHRSDGSGTTHLFTNYLTYNSANWSGGNGLKGLHWAKNSLEAKGNDAVANAVSENEYTIGYVELEYTEKHNLSPANIQLKVGTKTKFVEPKASSLEAAVPSGAAQALSEGSDEALQESFGKPRNEATPGESLPYPITGFSWLILRPIGDGKSQETLCKFLEFLPGWASKNAETYKYESFPSEIVVQYKSKIDKYCGYSSGQSNP
jgi:phosphate transport system substrate-binding protein